MLFPEQGSAPYASEPGEDRGVNAIERAVLSIAITALLGLALNVTPWGIRPAPIVAALSALTLGLVAAVYRRRQVPPDERCSIPFREWLATPRGDLFEPETLVDAALNALVALSVLVAAATVGYAVLTPSPGGEFTERYLLGEGADGDRIAGDYTRNLTAGRPASFVVGLGNHEGERTIYTVVVALQ